jgi:hypothetical protein
LPVAGFASDACLDREVRLGALAIAEDPVYDRVIDHGEVILDLYARVPQSVHYLFCLQRSLAGYFVYSLAHL